MNLTADTGQSMSTATPSGHASPNTLSSVPGQARRAPTRAPTRLRGGHDRSQSRLADRLSLRLSAADQEPAGGAARRRSRAQEIVYRGEKRFTYAEFRERVGRLAAALVALGVKPGDTVAVMDWDSHRYLECFYAVPMIGAVLHTVNVRLSPEQLVYTIGHAEDDVILINAEFLPLIEHIGGASRRCAQYVLINDDKAVPETKLSFAGEYEELLAAADADDRVPRLRREHARHDLLLDRHDRPAQGRLLQPSPARAAHARYGGHDQLPPRPAASHREDVYMPLTPMFHVHAWGIPYVATMLGVKQVYPGKYLPEVLLKLLVTEKVTFSHCVPTILNMLVANPATKQFDLSNWKVLIGGAALPKSVALLALERGIDLAVGYGLSESCPVLTITNLSTAERELPRRRAGGAARAHRHADRDGRPQGRRPGRQRGAGDEKTSGEIVVRAPWLTQGYFKDHANSERLWEGGWMHTQDIAVRNAAGSVRITDRAKDIVKIGGEWLSSLEIEDILVLHPGVAEAAVIGKPDEKWSEVPLGLVVRRKSSERPRSPRRTCAPT